MKGKINHEEVLAPVFTCTPETIRHELTLANGRINIKLTARHDGARLYSGRPAGLLRQDNLRWEERVFKELLGEIIRFGCHHRVAEDLQEE